MDKTIQERIDAIDKQVMGINLLIAQTEAMLSKFLFKDCEIRIQTHKIQVFEFFWEAKKKRIFFDKKPLADSAFSVRLRLATKENMDLVLEKALSTTEKEFGIVIEKELGDWR